MKAWWHQNSQNAALRTASVPDTNLPTGPRPTFKPKSTFCPVVNNACLIAFTKKVSYEVDSLCQTTKSPATYNLTKQENAALRELSNNEDLIIKRADKGGAVVVWGRDQYIQEAHNQLHNAEYYTPLLSNPLDHMTQELTDILNDAVGQKWIFYVKLAQRSLPSICYQKYIKI